ncbi:MAG: Gfo/Idh/MocA family oxidoreductase [Lewinellaceae bacterium]|nr:Gfo/Idh/MocA family oxidoreductase [Lewinellaceae bacterium]
MPKKIKTGLCSYGMSGLVFHGPLLRIHPGFEVTHVLERTKNHSAALYGREVIVRDFNDLISDRALDLIVVNTPDHTHYEMAKAALNAGKHVVVEKPFVQEAAQAEELIALAKQKGLVLTIFQNRRWDSDFLTVRRVIDNGLLGRLVEFESHYDRYRNFIQPGTWKESAENGAGIVYNLGSHLIDQALCLFGKPAGVYADLRIVRTDGEVQDFFDIDLVYPDVKVKLKSSYLVRESGPRFILHGTEGSFLKWGLDPQEDELKKGTLPNAPGWGAEPEAEWGLLNTTLGGLHLKGRVETVPGNYPAFYANLYDVLTAGADLAVKPGEALLAMQVIGAVFESAEKGGNISL